MNNEITPTTQTAQACLSEILRLSSALQPLLERLSKARAQAEMPTIPYGHARVKTSRTADRTADAVARIAALEADIAALLERLSLYKAEASTLLLNVSHLPARSVLEQRYLCQRTWREIAHTMGCTQRQAYNLHRKGLDALDSKIT